MRNKGIGVIKLRSTQCTEKLQMKPFHSITFSENYYYTDLW